MIINLNSLSSYLLNWLIASSRDWNTWAESKIQIGRILRFQIPVLILFLLANLNS